MKYPKEYPIDSQLIIEAETISSGADIHDIRQQLSIYTGLINLYNKQDIKSKNKYHYNVIKSERMLRGLVAEAKINRFKILYNKD